MNSGRYLISGLFLITTASCVSSKSIQLEHTSQYDQNLFSFSDARPLEQRHSARSRDARVSTFNLGDDILKPSGPLLLQAKLHQILGQKIFGKQIVLKELSVEVIESSRSRLPDGVEEQLPTTGNAGRDIPNKVALKAARALGVDRIGAEKFIEVFLLTAVDGQEFFSRKRGYYRFGSEEDAALEILSKAIDEVVASINESITATKPMDGAKTR